MKLELPLLAHDRLILEDIFPAILDDFPLGKSPKTFVLAEPKLSAPLVGLAPLPSRLDVGLMNSVLDQVQSRLNDGLADTETLQMLFELIIGEGASAVLAVALIERFGSLGGVVSAPAASLSAIAGITLGIIALLKLVHHTTFRIAHAEVKNRPVIGNWDKLIDYLTVTMAYEPVEQLRVLFLNNRNALIADEVMARGTVNHVPIYPRELVKRGLALEATAVILVHNHPSGCSDPSRDDITMTKEVKAALLPVEIVLHDHVIIGKGNWFSFRQRNLLGGS